MAEITLHEKMESGEKLGIIRDEIKETVHLVADSVNRWRGQRIGHFGLGAIGRIGRFLGADCHFAGQ